MSPKPTLVFVHGAWHQTNTWDKVVPLLETQQYKCVCVPLPSTTSNHPTSLLDDIEAVRRAITTETSQGRDVVLVVHSYGGLVGSSALKGLTRHDSTQDTTSSSSPKTSSGHALGFIMLASGFAQTGSSFLNGGPPPPWWKADAETGFAIITGDSRQLFYHDLPVEEGEHWVQELKHHSLITLSEGGEHAYAGWIHVPVWYLHTTEDKALPIEVQRLFVQGAKDAGGDVTTREVPSSHSPMLSKPKETVDFIQEAVASITGQ